MQKIIEINKRYGSDSNDITEKSKFYIKASSNNKSPVFCCNALKSQTNFSHFDMNLDSKSRAATTSQSTRQNKAYGHTRLAVKMPLDELPDDYFNYYKLKEYIEKKKD